MNLVADRGLQGDETPGVDPKPLPCAHLQRVHGAAGVHEAEAVAFEPLHDKSLAAEQADADLPLERDPDRDAARGAEERVLLADQLPAQFLQVQREDLPGVGGRERHLLFAGSLVGEHRHEEALAGDQALAGSEQRSDHARSLLAAVTEDGLHLDAGRHVHHRSGLSDRAFAGVELDFHELHFASENAELNFMRSGHGAP